MPWKDQLKCMNPPQELMVEEGRQTQSTVKTECELCHRRRVYKLGKDFRSGAPSSGSRVGRQHTEGQGPVGPWGLTQHSKARCDTSCVRTKCWKLGHKKPVDHGEALGFHSVGKDLKAKNIVARFVWELIPVAEKRVDWKPEARG